MSLNFQWTASSDPGSAFSEKGDFPRLTYWPADWKHLSALGMWELAESTLALSNFYMDFLELRFDPKPFGAAGEGFDPWGGQRERVHALCVRLVKEGWERRFPDSPENRAWFEALLLEICDEVENQC
ncbi:MAG: hypothetical protein ABFE07_28575 [Armatimonadia bacterium]